MSSIPNVTTDPAAIKASLDAIAAPLRDVLTALSDVIATVNTANGWKDKSVTFGDSIALLHSEASEALEAYRTDGFADTTRKWCVTCRTTPEARHICKPEGVLSELADVIIRTLDTTDSHEELSADALAVAIVSKVRYNATRGYRHGDKNL